MAAPATTALGTPAGIRLGDGYQTAIVFARNDTVSFWEKSIKPPGMDGGDMIDNTTMRNTTWRTRAPRQLITLTDFTLRAAYDPNVYNQILNDLLNQEGAITIHFPDGSTLDFFGYLQKFEPQEITEGNQPEADITVVPTNWDPANAVEAAPVLTSVSGT